MFKLLQQTRLESLKSDAEKHQKMICLIVNCLLRLEQVMTYVKGLEIDRLISLFHDYIQIFDGHEGRPS